MDADDPTAYDDAVIEDMVTCRYCGASWDVSEITVCGGDVNICDECGERDRGELLVEVVRLRERVERALIFIGDPGWRNDLCDCPACRKVKAAYAEKHGVYHCEQCDYRGPIGTVACQCYDYSCRGAGEDARGTGCPHGFGTCPVCWDGERDAWEVVRAMRAALEEGDGDGR